MAISESMMMCEIFIGKEMEFPIHSHMHQQIGYIVYGCLELTIGDETQLCYKGDSYMMPSNMEHKARAIEDTLMLDVFHPHRTEYL